MVLYIFDKDNTLVGGMSNRPANIPAEQQLLPGVAIKIAELRAQGHRLAIASNQGGVAWGFISLEQADELLRDCASKIGGVDAYEFCPHDDKKGTHCECRKPRAGMLKAIMRRLNASARETIMIGDQDADQQAAVAAGVPFIWAADFFGWRR